MLQNCNIRDWYYTSLGGRSALGRLGAHFRESKQLILHTLFFMFCILYLTAVKPPVFVSAQQQQNTLIGILEVITNNGRLTFTKKRKKHAKENANKKLQPGETQLNCCPTKVADRF